MTGFRAISDNIYVAKHPILDVNSSLIIGRDKSLLIDTLSTAEQAKKLASDIRQLTNTPITIVNTHAHFDHVFGNATIVDELDVTDILASADTIDQLGYPSRAVAEAVRACEALVPELVADVAVTVVCRPTRVVAEDIVLDLGGRTVRVFPVGAAHTRGDVVVIADDVVFAGDLVEEGAPPDIEGADLDGWVAALDVLLPYMNGVVVPGHGEVVDRAFVRAQRDVLDDWRLSR